MGKVKTTIEIEEGLDEQFRKAVIERKGFHKGVLGEAVEEAISLWVQTDSKPKKVEQA
ncbi:MAG: hypothetical protein JRM99_09005 [Nitrososphaerota archaeon]|nr:hypothetical protein [Nitrososphaerota archaeon]